MTRKPLEFVGSSKDDLSGFPEEVKVDIGYALHLIQTGLKPDSAKPMQGFGGAGVLEIVENYSSDTYRAVCTVKFKDQVYVLHAFQKKSKRGIKTAQEDIDLIRRRLKIAEEHYQAREKRGGQP